ncbi:exostosin-like glycosyltransferase [Raphidocelis subcapitata]|uniref:Exostosin-like glycosyltransferase n=1 Tax=Raphidocelis subcapitata TaxID=307507 RepID=A0A2V0NWB2_9CHLO|nr:exostosin-like glycosyltransferase [Raphidocelis subcapitata]|eukprot:GBF90972.1 exostosin-like glycosyltransferase [Raphidocelis subcapitata]
MACTRISLLLLLVGLLAALSLTRRAARSSADSSSSAASDGAAPTEALAARRLLQDAGAPTEPAAQPRRRRTAGRPTQVRCVGAVGPWCGPYYEQRPVPFKPPRPRGAACPGGCSGIGVCHGDTGRCDCPAGWGGPACADPDKRPCTKSYREPRGSRVPNSHIGPDKRDLNWSEPGSTYSRCAGICDDDVAACYCDPQLGNPKYGRVPAPPGSPPGAPPLQEGRPLFDPCNRLADDGRGNNLSWNGFSAVPFSRVYGPDGWCVADEPKVPACGCGLDGYGGPGCSKRSEMLCLNQCSGRGRCRLGFCHCDAGWWGLDCAHAASEAAAVAPRPEPPDWLRELAVDAWRCAGTGFDCGNAAIASAERAANWSRLAPSFAPPGAAGPGGEDESDPLSAFRLSGAAARGRRRGGGGGADGGADGGAGGGTLFEERRLGRGGAAPLPAAAPGDDYGGPGAEAPSEAERAAAAGAAAAPARRLSGPSAAGRRRLALRRRRALLGAADGLAAAAGSPPAAPPPEAAPPSPRPLPGRLRPLIYVYDVPAPYVSRMLSYRLIKDACSWRFFDHDGDNKTKTSPYPYGAEPLLIELLLGSPHRTLDPEEADFFFVPLLTTCWFHPIAGWADHPWWYVDTWSRVKHAVTFTHELLAWVKTAHPYWNRTGGADHIWHFAHDEGACWAPREVYDKSIILTHWGRLDRDHTSGTSYTPDNYSMEVTDDPLQLEGFTHLLRGHPCYTPGKDLAIPLFRGPDRYKSSPYLGAPQPDRDILLFHRGRMGLNDLPQYSRGVRQRIARAAKDGNWSGRYNIHVGGYDEIEGDYGQLLARSVFCLVAAGDGWSARFDDAMLHGCIPVIVIDRVVGPWGHQLRWSAFSVRVAEADAERLPELLTAIPPDRVRRMQRAMAAVWRRFVWLSHPALHRLALEAMEANAEAAAEAAKWGDPLGQRTRPWLRPLQRGDWRDDAFQTVLQWLYSKLQQRQGGGGVGAGGGGGGGASMFAAAGGEGGDQQGRRRHQRHRWRGDGAGAAGAD